MKIILFLLTCFAATVTSIYSQELTSGDESVNVAALRIDYQKSYKNYLGNYHFGFSEGESNLELKMVKNKLYGELTFSVWDNKRNTWKNKSIVLKNLAITGNILTANGWYGIFVLHNNDTSRPSKGLVIYNGQNDIKDEIGFRLTD